MFHNFKVFIMIGEQEVKAQTDLVIVLHITHQTISRLSEHAPGLVRPGASFII